ncbi:MAG: 4-hydroxy-tetrahydrodipicolinate reductase, partial [Ferruginibacter sp.]|nr:4-hydroxy-tetrahydrodipicolinate reductase [Ferruginibacter sp.]
KINDTNLADLTKENLQQADVAIEFTNPESAIENMRMCINAGVPIVCGSTGWVADEDGIKKYCTEQNGSLLYSSNFSIGVNIFFEINRRLAALMAQQKDYNVSIEETHHTQKKDAPSGTAITIAQQIISERSDKNNWTLNALPVDNEILIESKRIDTAPGTHHVRYTSAIDDIEIIHTAHSRKGFAAGALAAAEFIVGKTGIYSMGDVLKSTL